jgi:ABC-type Co2+ transport system permease subunit
MSGVSLMIIRITKYLIMGLLIAVCCYIIPGRKLLGEEVMLIAASAAATFAILDTYLPSIGSAARTGAGFTLGSNLVGGFM